MKVTVKITHLPTGAVRASCPALPGCSVLAATPHAALDKLDLAIRAYLSSLDVIPPEQLTRVILAEETMGAA